MVGGVGQWSGLCDGTGGGMGETSNSAHTTVRAARKIDMQT